MTEKFIRKKPTDINQIAKLVVDIATEETEPSRKREHESIRESRRSGGKKGGKARAKSLSPEEKSKIAHKAARARWDNKKK